MAEVYTFLYCIENSLRIFLDNLLIKEYGENYIGLINISTGIKGKIKNRKKDEKLNKWLSIRGDNDLFYTDLDELGNIIQNNWEICKIYFQIKTGLLEKFKKYPNVDI